LLIPFPPSLFLRGPLIRRPPLQDSKSPRGAAAAAAPTEDSLRLTAERLDSLPQAPYELVPTGSATPFPPEQVTIPNIVLGNV